MTQEKMSPLRQRMIEDMRIRGMGDKHQKSHIRAIKDFAAFLGLSKAICDRAGVGSYTTASRLLGELRAEEAALLSMPEDVADEYRSFQDFIWTAAMREATCGFEAERSLLGRDRNKAEALARERLDVIREMEFDAAAEAKRMARYRSDFTRPKRRWRIWSAGFWKNARGRKHFKLFWPR